MKLGKRDVSYLKTGLLSVIQYERAWIAKYKHLGTNKGSILHSTTWISRYTKLYNKLKQHEEKE